MRDRLMQGTPLFEKAWVVLAMGESFNPDLFQQRETARERLRREVRNARIPLREYVWVWDEIDRAQLVLARFHSQGEAKDCAQTFRSRGLAVRVEKSANLPLGS